MSFHCLWAKGYDLYIASIYSKTEDKELDYSCCHGKLIAFEIIYFSVK